MQLYTRLAVLCLSAGLGTQAFAQAQVTNAPASPTLTPDAEQQAREILRQSLQPVPNQPQAAGAAKITEREAARKRLEAEAQRRLEEKQRAKTTPAAQPATDIGHEQRQRELQRIESEVEKARKRREQPEPAPAPAPRSPVAPPSAPAAALAPSPDSTLTPDAEAKARELLNQKWTELTAERAKASPAPVPAASVPIPAPVPPPVVPAPVVATTPKPALALPLPSLTPEQEAAARDLLNQKTAELKVMPAKPVVATTPAPSPVAPPIVTPPPVVVTPVAIPAPVPVPPPTIAETIPVRVPAPAPASNLTAEQEAAARELLNQKTAELRGASVGVRVPHTAPLAVVPSPAPLVVQPVASIPVPQPTPAAVPNGSRQLTSEQESKALAALNQAAPQLHGAVRSTPAPAPERTSRASRTESAAPAQETKRRNNVKSEPVPVVQPTGPRTKAQKLTDLLQAYKADSITPLEYHTERAKILAEPNP